MFTNIDIYNLLNSDNDLWRRFEIGLWKITSNIEQNKFSHELQSLAEQHPRSWVDKNRQLIMKTLISSDLDTNLSDDDIDNIIKNLIVEVKVIYPDAILPGKVEVIK